MPTSVQPAVAGAAFYLACGAAVAGLVSIATSHILLALALAALLVSGQRFRIPPIWLPLLLFIVGTVLSLAFSDDPSLGRPQIRKFYVFLILPVFYSAVRETSRIRWLYGILGIVAGAASLRAIVQFFAKRAEAQALGRSFYEFYLGDRITGFMGHWMTFGGLQMIVILVVASVLLFAPPARRAWLLWACVSTLALSLVLSFTRSIWLGAAIGVLYLVWQWRPKLLLLAPLVLLAAYYSAPGSVQQRVLSVYKPSGTMDSNEHRAILRRTGWEMIQRHPWLGLGPEHVARDFLAYVPADVPRPLPTGWYEHLHNIYLQYAAERGVPTLLALLWLFGQVLFDFFRGLRKLTAADTVRRAILHGGVAVVLATLVAGLFEHNLGDSEVLMMLLVVIASGYAALQPSEPEHA